MSQFIVAMAGLLILAGTATAKPMTAEKKHRACVADSDCANFRFDCGTGCNTCGSPVSKEWLSHYEAKAAAVCKEKVSDELCDAESCTKVARCVKKVCVMTTKGE